MRFFLSNSVSLSAIFNEHFEIIENGFPGFWDSIQKRCKGVHCVDLGESFPTHSSLRMYVIATVICPNFHFSVSPHVPFLNLLFEQIANPNEYLLAEFGFDTAENEP